MREIRTFNDLLNFALSLELNETEPQPNFRIFGIRDVNPVSGVIKKRRVISDPNKSMRRVHKAFIHWLNSAINLEKIRKALRFATGSVQGSSHVENVRLHSRHRFFYLLDIKNAFPTVDGVKLADVLVELCPSLADCRVDLCNFLRRYFLMPVGGLYVGGNASNYLYNLYAGWLIDQNLGTLCQRLGITYSRYVDDLTFSSDQSITEANRRSIRDIIETADFEINHAKAKVLDITKGPVFINGVGIRLGGELFVPGHYVRTLRGLMNKAMYNGDVKPAVVEGKMAVFFFIKGHRRDLLNRTERNLVAQYDQFRKVFVQR